MCFIVTLCQIVTITDRVTESGNILNQYFYIIHEATCAIIQWTNALNVLRRITINWPDQHNTPYQH